MPIKILGNKGCGSESESVKKDVQILMKSIEMLLHPNVSIEEFLSNSSTELDKYILKQRACGLEYIAGRFEISCKSYDTFGIAFSMYFKNKLGKWNEVKGESKHISLLCFNDEECMLLRNKGSVSFEIELPVMNTKESRREGYNTVYGDDINQNISVANNDKVKVCEEEICSEKIKEDRYEEDANKTSRIVETQGNNLSLEEELVSCREYAMSGYDAVKESYEKLNSALIKEKEKLHEANQRQNEIDRLQNDKQFLNQLHEMEKVGKEINNKVKTNIRDLHDRQDAFTIVLYGRTMAGKSTLMEILTHGDGASIGMGAQRTTLDVRPYTWKGLKIYDVPGTCSFGGSVDDKLAFEAAKSADMALFLLTDDAPQPAEADRLAELKELGKPVLGIVNVKQVLSKEVNSAKRKIEMKTLSKKINDQNRLNEIIQQFKEFAKKNGHDFSDIKFVSAHLKAAYLSQPERENDKELYRLSNFAAVENFIVEKVRRDGRFICYKTFMNSAALPMQQAITMFYRHSSESLKAYLTYRDKVKEIDEWKDGFIKSIKERYDNFIDKIDSQIETEINYVVNRCYESSDAGDVWKNRIEGLKINQQCQSFIRRIGEDATRKMRELSDELTQDLRYSGTAVNISGISMDEITDWQGGIMMVAPLLAFTPVGWIGAAVVGIGSWLFGDSKEEKIRQQKQELKEELNKSKVEIMDSVCDGVGNVLENEILDKQIEGFRNTLIDMCEMIAHVAYEQNNVAYIINKQYSDLNYDLFSEAVKYIGSKQYDEVSSARLVGKNFVLFTTGRISYDERHFIADLLNENLSVFNYRKGYSCEEMNKIIENDILKNEYDSVTMERDWGDMDIILIPSDDSISEEGIQITQQLLNSPIVKE